MPKLEINTVATITIEPDVALRLAALLDTYLAIKVDFDLLKSQMDEEKRKMKGELDLAGIKSANINGVPCTVVEGTSSSLDKLKFVELGGSLAMLENATVKKPKKAYLAIGKEKD